MTSSAFLIDLLNCQSDEDLKCLEVLPSTRANDLEISSSVSVDDTINFILKIERSNNVTVGESATLRSNADGGKFREVTEQKFRKPSRKAGSRQLIDRGNVNKIMGI